MSDILDAVSDCIGNVLKEHYTERKRAERGGVSARHIPVRSYKVSLKQAVFAVMKEAAAKASANFTLPF
jgi:hypothetical protein